MQNQFDTIINEIDLGMRQSEPNNYETADKPDLIANKADLMFLTNGWNDKNERITISIGENAASYKWMHDKQSSEYQMWQRILGIVMIIFSVGLSAETILPIDSNLAIDITRRVCTYIVTFITVLQNYLKLEQNAQNHLSASLEYSKLYHEIQQQMCMYRRDRRNATYYVTDCLKRYDTLNVNSPNITNTTIKKFKKIFNQTEISVPDIADRIQKIEIISEPLQMNLVEPTTQTRDPNQRRYGRHGVCNLDEIQNAFQIHGDISDKDIQTATPNELQELRRKFMTERKNYEYNRFIQHSEEND